LNKCLNLSTSIVKKNNLCKVNVLSHNSKYGPTTNSFATFLHRSNATYQELIYLYPKITSRCNYNLWLCAFQRFSSYVELQLKLMVCLSRQLQLSLHITKLNISLFIEKSEHIYFGMINDEFFPNFYSFMERARISP